MAARSIEPSMPLVVAVALALGLALAGCDDNGPEMTPGQDCLQCHSPVGGARPRLTLAGTVYPNVESLPDQGLADVVVHLTGADGSTRDLHTNAAGNFYTEEPIAFPVQVELRRGAASARMDDPVAIGACSSCHDLPPGDGAPGRAYVLP
jgi:hypothetical protein